MKKNFVFLLFVLSLVPDATVAQMRTESEMTAIAAKHFSAHSMQNGRRIRQVSPSNLYKQIDKESLAVYASEGTDGSIIVNRFQNGPEVLGYSTSRINAQQLPCGLHWWLESVNTTLMATGNFRTAVHHSAPAQEKILMKTQWGQDFPFNALCPELPTGQAPCGCVATALSQVMNYYKYPNSGTGYGSYTQQASSIQVKVPINSVYQWELLQNRYYGNEYDPKIIEAISQLCYDAGVACKMHYNADGSGAMMYEVCNAVSNNFSYDPTTVMDLTRDLYSNEEWMQTIFSSLDNDQPILYGAADVSSGGHCFVFDGYDAEGRVHVNWGWSGSADGFYYIDGLTPNNHSYTQQQNMVVGLRCCPDPLPGSYVHSQMGILDDIALSSTLRRSISIEDCIIYNHGHLDFDGTISAVVTRTDDCEEVYEKLFYDGSTECIQPMYGVRLSMGYWKIANLHEGEYVMTLVAQNTNEPEPSFIRAQGGMTHYPFTVSSAGSISFGEPYATAINAISNTNYPTPFFDLQGRRIATPTHGLYIHNGKKVMVK